MTRLLTPTSKANGSLWSRCARRSHFSILAGNETTRQLIGNLLVRVVEDPALLVALRADPSLVEPMVEESLRIDAPFPMLLRNLEQPTEQFGPEMCPARRSSSAWRRPTEMKATSPRPTSSASGEKRTRSRSRFGRRPARVSRCEPCPAGGAGGAETFVELVHEVAPAPGWIPRKTPVFFANGPVDLLVRFTSA